MRSVQPLDHLRIVIRALTAIGTPTHVATTGTDFVEAPESPTGYRLVAPDATALAVRASLRYVSYKDRKQICAELKEIYRAANEQAATEALERLAERWGDRYPAIIQTWESAWDQFTPMLRFPPAIRRILYTTNLVESINYQLRKITRNRGHFPNDDALLKLLYLGVRNHLARRASHRTEGRGDRPGPHTNGWKEALNQYEVRWPGRLDPR